MLASISRLLNPTSASRIQKVATNIVRDHATTPPKINMEPEKGSRKRKNFYKLTIFGFHVSFWGEVLFSIQVPFTWKYPFSFVEMSIQKSTQICRKKTRPKCNEVQPVGFKSPLGGILRHWQLSKIQHDSYFSLYFVVMMFWIHKKNGFFVGDVYIHEKDLNTVHFFDPQIEMHLLKGFPIKFQPRSQAVDPLSKVAVW